MSKNIELVVHWAPNEQTSFFIDHWRRNDGDLVLYPNERNGVPRIHIPLASIQYFELMPLDAPQNSDVLVEGSWFPRADLPEILGRYIRATEEANRAAKAAYLKVEGLWELVREWEKSSDSETRAHATRLRDLLTSPYGGVA